MAKINGERIWTEKYISEPQREREITEICEELGCSRLFAMLLINRGINNANAAKRFIDGGDEELYAPFLLKDMDRATERINRAVSKNEKICIYGDYDVDGVTSVSSLYLYLKTRGADVCIKIPKRDGEGYGVSKAGVEMLAAEGVSLIITVDTGITAADEVEFAKNFGVDFVITDHHECQEILPDACAVVNPHRKDCTYPFKELAGVGVVFKLICAYELRYFPGNYENSAGCIHTVCENFADFCAIGTVADVMPLIDENRIIVKAGLEILSETNRPGLAALINVCYAGRSSGNSKRVTAGQVGFGLAPRINAAGRMSDAMEAVSLMLAEDESEAERFAENLCEINVLRQQIEGEIAREAYAKIEDEHNFENDKVIVLAADAWHPGIIGIVASRITEKYGLPSILVSYADNSGELCDFDCGKGSGRSVRGMNLVKALGYCSDLLVKYGGHELAAGLSVRRGDFVAFKQKINEYARNNFSDEIFKINVKFDTSVTAADLTYDFARNIALLEPFGPYNPTPVFALYNAVVRRITNLSGGRHTKIELESDGIMLTALYFGISASSLDFEAEAEIDLLFNLDINTYKNRESIQLIIQDTRISERFATRILNEESRYAQIKNGSKYFLSENIIPEREDFAVIYRILRREYATGREIIDIKDLLLIVNRKHVSKINFIKLKYILNILNELNICSIEKIDGNIIRFKVPFDARKTSIDKSAILKKLIGQCADKNV